MNSAIHLARPAPFARRKKPHGRLPSLVTRASRYLKLGSPKYLRFPLYHICSPRGNSNRWTEGNVGTGLDERSMSLSFVTACELVAINVDDHTNLSIRSQEFPGMRASTAAVGSGGAGVCAHWGTMSAGGTEREGPGAHRNLAAVRLARRQRPKMPRIGVISGRSSAATRALTTLAGGLPASEAER